MSTAAPDNTAIATAYVPSGSSALYSQLADVAGWAQIFPLWISSIEESDDRWSVTGTGGERYDFYPHLNEDDRAIDVEILDELGGADVLRIRLMDVRGGCFVVATCSRLPGIPDSEWQRVRDAIAAGVVAFGRGV